MCEKRHLKFCLRFLFFKYAASRGIKKYLILENFILSERKIWFTTQFLNTNIVQRLCWYVVRRWLVLWVSFIFSDGWILGGWLLLVLFQSVILIGFWLKLPINWRHNVISWSFTETKLYQHLQKQSQDFSFPLHWRGCKLIATELYKMLSIW